MITIETFAIDPSPHIYLDENGEITYKSLFERDFEGDFKLLLDCIADNIYDEEDPESEDYVFRKIDYNQAVRDYKKCFKCLRR